MALIPTKINAEQKKITNLGKSTNEMGSVRQLDLLKHSLNYNNPHNITADQIQAVRKDDIANFINVLSNPETVFECLDVRLEKPAGGYGTGSLLNLNLEGDQIKLRCKNMYNSGDAGNFQNLLGSTVYITAQQLNSPITYFVFIYISTDGELPDSYPNIYPKDDDANGKWYLAASFDDLQKPQAQKEYYEIVLSKLPLASQLGFYVGFSLKFSSTVNINLPYVKGHLET